jgi:import inner membrane translocase subunit TIM23
VLALVYNGINSTVGYYRGKHDAANSVLSGIIAGAIFKSTKGLRPMFYSSSLVGAAAGLWAVGGKALL